jgi:hypothetical protein
MVGDAQALWIRRGEDTIEKYYQGKGHKKMS